MAAVSHMYTDPQLQTPKENDYRFMRNIVCSAIADIPAPDATAEAINKRTKPTHLETKTMTDLSPLFTEFDGASRSNKKMLPKRGWCAIKEYRVGMLIHSSHN